MKILRPNFIIESEIDGKEMLRNIEKIGRTCYKSEDNITDESAEKFVAGLIKRGHEAMIEHESITVRFTVDRGVTHEQVRHRIASFAQESTRYCNYAKDKFGNEINVIDISNVMKLEIGKELTHPVTKEKKVITLDIVMQWIDEWTAAMNDAERHYFNLVNNWCPAQLARSVLTNSTKAEIVITMNLREWRHFFYLRAAKPAHPQMKEVAIPLLKLIRTLIPVVFDDLVYDKDFETAYNS